MALTVAEENRLQEVETTLAKLALLVKGGGSINQLNRLLILSQEQMRQVSADTEALETQMTELLELARKLQ